MLIRLINRFLRTVNLELRKSKSAQHSNPSATLHPDGTQKGRVLLSYIPDMFTATDPDALSHKHTHYWESAQIVATYLANGFAVDVIHYDDSQFVPRRDYDILVSARTNLERLSKLVPESCLKIAHLDTAHYLTNNANADARLVNARERRGISLRNLRMIEQNWALEAADMGCVLGNEFTAGTYEYAGKPVYRIPISCTDTYDWPQDRDFEEARSNYLWFGSGGFVHKGLDLVLEAFRDLPSLSLTVCGPINAEIRFAQAFHTELYATPNISTPGWMDVSSPDFSNLCRQSIATIYPSCAEGGGGSVLTCMHAGLIPIVTREASVDVGDFGIVLSDGTIAEIQAATAKLAEMSATELENRARASWEYARANHTQDTFAKNYTHFVESIVMPEWHLRQK